MSLPAARRAVSSSSSVVSASVSHGDTRASNTASLSHMFPIPETARWICSASPSRVCGVRARRLAAIASKSGGSARMSGPRRRRVRSSSSSTGPCHSTASCVEPRTTSHGGLPWSSLPRGCTRQRPFILRWLRSMTPPSKERNRFLLRDVLDGRAGVRRFDLHPFAHEHLQPPGRAGECVSLGHRRKRTARVSDTSQARNPDVRAARPSRSGVVATGPRV